jgi:hypothetical protein
MHQIVMCLTPPVQTREQLVDLAKHVFGILLLQHQANRDQLLENASLQEYCLEVLMIQLNQYQVVGRKMWKMMTVSRPVYVRKIIAMATKVMKKKQQTEIESPHRGHPEQQPEDLLEFNQPQDGNLLTS